jgi:hypothetical protein
MSWTTRASDPGRSKRFFSKTSGPSLRPIQPPFQWVPGANRQGSDVDDSPPPIAEVKNAWNYKSTPPIRVYDVDRFSFLLSFQTILQPCVDLRVSIFLTAAELGVEGAGRQGRP